MSAKSRIVMKTDRAISIDALNAFRSGAREDLHRALDLRPWQPSPLDIESPQPPAWCVGTRWEKHWQISRDLRVRLIEADTAMSASNDIPHA